MCVSVVVRWKRTSGDLCTPHRPHAIAVIVIRFIENKLKNFSLGRATFFSLARLMFNLFLRFCIFFRLTAAGMHFAILSLGNDAIV